MYRNSILKLLISSYTVIKSVGIENDQNKNRWIDIHHSFLFLPLPHTDSESTSLISIEAESQKKSRLIGKQRPNWTLPFYLLLSFYRFRVDRFEKTLSY